MPIGKSWSYAAALPDLIVGYTPHANYYNIAGPLARYLSLYHHVHGTGTRVPFPGTKAAWTAKWSGVSQDVLAKFLITLALREEEVGGQVYNIASRASPTSWKEEWPALCNFFGLIGVEPSGEREGGGVRAFLEANRDEERKMKEEERLRKWRVEGKNDGVAFMEGVFGYPVDRQMSVRKAWELWGENREEMGRQEVWRGAFERFRRGGVIV